MKKSVKLLLSILVFSLTICIANAEHNNYITSPPDDYYFVIKNDNSLWKIDRKTFESTKVMNGVKSVSRYLVLKEDNTLWELDKERNYIKIADDVESISSSSTISHSLFVKTDKSLWGYGWGYEGQLGKTVDDEAITPVKIMNNVEKAEAGEAHSIILKTDGSVLMLGTNDYGALGVDKSIEQTHDPIKVFEGAKDINAGSYSSFVFTKDDTLWRWGTNYGGWVGLNVEEKIYEPIPYIENAKAVQSHSGFNMVLKNDGTLWMYGETENSKKALTELHGANYPEDGLFGGKEIDVGVSVMKDVNSINDWNQANHDTLVVKDNGDLYVADVVLLSKKGHWEVRTQKIMEDVHLKEYQETKVITPFSDMANYPEEVQKAVNSLKKAEIIEGTSKTEFSPDKEITRAEIAALLLRMQNLPINSGETNFSDVSKTDWFYNVADTSKKYNIVNGYDDNTFRGYEPITKEQLVVLAFRVLQNENKAKDEKAELLFSDKNEISEWAAEDIEIAASSGLIKNQDEAFNSKEIATRAEAAVILYQLYNMI